MSRYITYIYIYVYIYIDIIFAFSAMKSVSNGNFFSNSPSLCGRHRAETRDELIARTLPLRKPTPLAPKVFPPMLENNLGKRKGFLNDKDLPPHFVWCLFVFMFIVSLVFLVFVFSCISVGRGFVFVFAMMKSILGEGVLTFFGETYKYFFPNL